MSNRPWRDASGRLTFDWFGVDSGEYPATCHAIAETFGLTLAGELIIGPESMFWRFQRGEQLIGLDWDIWMGFMIVACSESTEALVRDIAAWFDLVDRPSPGR